uniref:Uncharacterized protein n=1 Tax=Anabas testudineus TaxID=64144 RepID=A0AAQ6ILG4_ANATE
KGIFIFLQDLGFSYLTEMYKLFCPNLNINNLLNVYKIAILFEELMVLLPRAHKVFFLSQVPSVQKDVIQNFEVKVQGDTFYSKEVRKVLISVYDPVTVIQTDKPIYLPGQTVHFRVITLNTRLRSVNQTVSVCLCTDANTNTIGRWEYITSNGTILQLSYSLNSEAQEGTYYVNAVAGSKKTVHSFKVEKYVLPKFSVKLNVSNAIRMGEDLNAEVFLQLTSVHEARFLSAVSNLTVFLFRTVGFVVSVTEGELSVKVKVSPEMAPDFVLLAYAVLPSEIVIASSAQFSTEECYSNKVSLRFSPSSAVPGEKLTMQVMSESDSLCGVSVVDQSVFIMEPRNRLNADKIFRLLAARRPPYNSVEDENRCMDVRPKRFIFPDYGDYMDDDAHSILKVILHQFIIIIQHKVCKETFKYVLTSVDRGRVGSLDYPPVKTVRTFFPETWIWDLVAVGESGMQNLSVTVPDTITTWETEAFCLSPQGFSLAPRQNLTVFQPFFIELTLPYSIIRGEQFELKATIFNYLTSCIMVTVTPEPSLQYTLTPLSGDQYTSCLCGNERKTLRWSMNPLALGTVNVSVTAEAVASQDLCGNEVVSMPDRGRIDMVTQSLIVKVGKALSEDVDIQLPENVIDGSARASVSVLGDILGRALQNLDGLLRMPHGCGEQNMALLAPNIYILQYLRSTKQLTPAISEKATNFLISGYQRQLNYKHRDGAYSAFGQGEGNTWLTGFVLRTFVKARSFIYIDPEVMKASFSWLKSIQQGNGCFKMIGKLFHNRMKGGVSDEVTLSAYITAAFLEMNISADPVITKSLSCLKESISDLSNTYTTALLAYVFTLAGDMETRGHLLQHLDTVASKQGGLFHWSQTAAETSASLSVEISSYVLLAKLSASPTGEELIYSSRIVKWLTGQQNYYGGFSSTQDTVVALQALALYSTLVFSPQGSSTVTVQSPSGQLTFDVNQKNKLLYQEKTLQDTTGKYSLEVKGTACASVQVSRRTDGWRFGLKCCRQACSFHSSYYLVPVILQTVYICLHAPLVVTFVSTLQLHVLHNVLFTCCLSLSVGVVCLKQWTFLGLLIVQLKSNCCILYIVFQPYK